MIVVTVKTQNSHHMSIVPRMTSVPCVFRSSPGERREREGGEGGLGKRVRKKRKIYMDSGDEDEDNQEEEEVMIEDVANAGPEKHCNVVCVWQLTCR